MTDVIVRNTKVVSVSLDPRVVRMMDRSREESGQSRSAFVQGLIKRYSENKRWQQLYAWGEETTNRMGLTSEADIERILNED